MGAQGFWDDQESAAKVSAEHARTSRRLETWQELERDVGDLGALVELADEDESLAGEVEEQLADDRGTARRAGGGAALLRAATTRATRSSPSTPAPAAPTPRTGPRWCCG